MILKVPCITVEYINKGCEYKTITLYNMHFYRKTKIKSYIERFVEQKAIIINKVIFGNYEICIETNALFNNAVSSHFYQTEIDKKRTENFNKQ